MLDDPDLIALLQDSSGIQAHAVFCLLLMAAKAQDNGGTFKHSTAVIASMVRLPVEAFKAGLATLLSRTDWIIADANTVTIRSYKKWNSWGGTRANAGRKPSANQDAPKNDSTGRVPVSVTDSVSSTTTTLSDSGESDGDKEPSPAEQRFNDFWTFYPRKVGKGAAQKVFLRLKADDQLEAIEQAEAYGQAYEMAPESRRQFFKHPATWLNARGWEDDHAEWTLLIEGK